MPCAGTVVNMTYQPGQFIDASESDATVHNEQNALMIETSSKKKVLCVQVAGLLARRIVCWVQPGELAVAGERFGLIRFGSRVDGYLPVGVQPIGSIGQTAVAGETVIADLVLEEAARAGEMR